MKSYIITTGIVFALLTVAHVVRIFTENPHLGETPWYVAITLATAALSVWAFVALRRARP